MINDQVTCTLRALNYKKYLGEVSMLSLHYAHTEYCIVTTCLRLLL